MNLLNEFSARIEHALTESLPPQTSVLCEAMRYSVLNGGKRLRPLLVYSTAKDCGISLDLCDAAAVAVECIHCYSLIHDDLPAMDNDALRRGKPTCHIVFGDAMAILAGDALQSFALEVLSYQERLPAPRIVAMLKTLTMACGVNGMVAGQAQDILQQAHSSESLESMHRLKTGALIQASCELALQATDRLPTQVLESVRNFARDIGLAFQIQDDILDIEAPSAILGKPQGSDLQSNKATYPALIGLPEAKRMATELLNSAIQHLSISGHDFPNLTQLAYTILERKH